jgi:hypothetical protein
MKRLGKTTKTKRGFETVEFKDHYGAACSLQASSLAVYETSAIWLGVDDADPKIFHGKAAEHGIKTEATCGWVPYPIPDDVLLTTRMHLNRDQVGALIAHLQKWLRDDTFKIPPETKRK